MFCSRPRPGHSPLLLSLGLVMLGCQAPTPNEVDGQLITFNDNGSWCWFQDERVIVDTTNGTMLIGSVAASEGEGGPERGGNVDLVTYELATGAIHRLTLDKIQEDDHNLPALLIRPDGRYLAMYSNHNKDKLSRYRVSVRPHDSSEFMPRQHFDWKKEIDSDFNTTYSNLFYLTAENRTYDFSRADGRSPNMLFSDDQGSTWQYGGRLTEIEDAGYVNGYYKYASNGVDRIHVVGTEHHPRDYNTSIYHGYVEAGILYRADNAIVDENLFDDDAREPTELTTVFAANTVVDGEVMTHAWPTDVQTDMQGRVRLVFTARANDVPENTNFKDHRFFYAHFDGKDWHVHQLAKAGARLFSIEQDYTGLAALHPTRPDTLYISTNIDPRSGAPTRVHEIYEGVTQDDGETFQWTAITQNSAHDNIRPIVPRWDSPSTALLWLRGTMRTSQSYDMAVVGLIRTPE